MILLSGILFYELLEHFRAVRAALSSAGKVLSPVLAGIGVAYVIIIPASFLLRTVFRKKRENRFFIALSNIVAFIFVVGAAAAVLLLVLPKAAGGIRELLGSIGDYYRNADALAEGLLLRLDASGSLASSAGTLAGRLASRAESLLPSLLSRLMELTAAAARFTANAVLALVFAAYLLAEKRRLLAFSRRLLDSTLSEKNSGRAMEFFAFANATFRGYLSGQAISCSILGGLCYLGMRLLGLPYPAVISVAIGAFQLIPIVGVWLSTAACALIVLFASGRTAALVFLVLILVIQQIDDNLIGPRVLGGAVGLSGAWVLLGIIVGGGFFGLKGLLFAVPATALVYRVIADWTNERAKSRGLPLLETVPEYAPGAAGRGRRPFFNGMTRAQWLRKPGAKTKKDRGSEQDPGRGE